MSNCPKCKTQYSEGQNECSKCGVIFANYERYLAKGKQGQKHFTPEKKKVSLVVIIGGGFIGLCFVFGVFAELTGAPKSSPAKAQQEIARAGFSGWDGSNRDLEKIIKDTMHDPSSYEHDKTVYVDMKDHLIVKTTFRGKNAFGAIVRNSVSAKTDLQGKVLEIISKEN